MSQISLSKLTLHRLRRICFVSHIVDTLIFRACWNIRLNAVIRMSICSRNKQQVLEKSLKELITGSVCFMMHFYILLCRDAT